MAFKRHIWPMRANEVREDDYLILWLDYASTMVMRVDVIISRRPGDYKFSGDIRWNYHDGSSRVLNGWSPWYEHTQWIQVARYQ